MKEKPLTEFINVNGEKERQKEVKGLWELPEEWKWVKLGDLGKFEYGYTASATNEDTGVNFLRITDIDETGKIKWDQVPFCKISYRDFQKYVLRKGDLLFARIGATTGKATYIPDDINAVFASYLIRLKITRGDVLPKFVFYFTQTPYYWENIKEEMGNKLRKGINAKELARILIPLPPLEEQKRIVKKLDEIRLRVEEAKRLVREAREKAEQLMASALHEVFSKAEERGWKWRHFDKIVNLKAKFKVGKLKKSEYQNEGLLPVIDQGENFIAGYTNNVELKYNGPLPVVIFGDHTTNVKYVDFPFVVGADGVKILVPKSDVYPKYLYYTLLKFKPKPEGYKRHFSKLKDKDRVYPVPSLEEQKRIVAYLDAVSERARQLIKLYEEREKELEKLWFSALDKAFKGKL